MTTYVSVSSRPHLSFAGHDANASTISLLSSLSTFPAPPSHVPSLPDVGTANPPPTSCPREPLPPLPLPLPPTAPSSAASTLKGMTKSKLKRPPGLQSISTDSVTPYRPPSTSACGSSSSGSGCSASVISLPLGASTSTSPRSPTFSINSRMSALSAAESLRSKLTEFGTVTAGATPTFGTRSVGRNVHGRKTSNSTVASTVSGRSRHSGQSSRSGEDVMDRRSATPKSSEHIHLRNEGEDHLEDLLHAHDPAFADALSSQRALSPSPLPPPPLSLAIPTDTNTSNMTLAELETPMLSSSTSMSTLSSSASTSSVLSTPVSSSAPQALTSHSLVMNKRDKPLPLVPPAPSFAVSVSSPSPVRATHVPRDSEMTLAAVENDDVHGWGNGDTDSDIDPDILEDDLDLGGKRLSTSFPMPPTTSPVRNAAPPVSYKEVKTPTPSGSRKSRARTKEGTVDRDGAGSPDIDAIIKATPRPRPSRSSSRASSVVRSRRSIGQDSSAGGCSQPPSSFRSSSFSQPYHANSAPVSARSTQYSVESGDGDGRGSWGMDVDEFGRVLDAATDELEREMEREESAGLPRSSRRSSAAFEFMRRRTQSIGMGLGMEDDAFYAGEAEVMLGFAEGAPTVPGQVKAEEKQEGDDEEGDDEEEVHSDIDLHTPLPHIMLRQGVLSPQSKILADDSGTSLGLGRPSSVASNMTSASMTSVMTKSGIFKDSRDTERRRTRHRDGKLLRGGLGLTTGLGWSDSEDEDAPSPLTSRLSKLSLSRTASVASLRSSHSGVATPRRQKSDASTRPNAHPLSKSVSSMTLSSLSLSQPSSSSAAPTSFKMPKTPKTAPVNRVGRPPVPPLSLDMELVNRLEEGKESGSSASGQLKGRQAINHDRDVVNFSYPLSPDLKSNRGSVESGGSRSSGGSSDYGIMVPSKYGSSAKVSSLNVASLSKSVGYREARVPRSISPASGSVSGSNTASSSSRSSASIATPPDSMVLDPGMNLGEAGEKKMRADERAERLRLAQRELRQSARDESVGRAGRIPRSRTPVATRSRANSVAKSQTLSYTAKPEPPLPTSPTSSSTPKPLRLPALHQPQSVSRSSSGSSVQSASAVLQPGQPAAKTGSLLGYNRNLHDKQRIAAATVNGKVTSLPASSSTPSSAMRGPRAYGSVPSSGVSGSASAALRPPRTGTGMVYRQSSLPATASPARTGLGLRMPSSYSTGGALVR